MSLPVSGRTRIRSSPLRRKNSTACLAYTSNARPPTVPSMPGVVLGGHARYSIATHASPLSGSANASIASTTPASSTRPRGNAFQSSTNGTRRSSLSYQATSGRQFHINLARADRVGDGPRGEHPRVDVAAELEAGALEHRVEVRVRWRVDEHEAARAAELHLAERDVVHV